MTGNDLHCEGCGRRNGVFCICRQCSHLFCLRCLSDVAQTCIRCEEQIERSVSKRDL